MSQHFEILSDLTWPYPSTYPPTHQTIHLPMGGGVSTDFKSSNRIKISLLVQVLLNFYWFLGMGGGGYPETCMCACIWHHREFSGIPPIGGGHLQLKLSSLTCICACMCVHVHVCGGHPPTTHPNPLEPQGPKTPKFNKSWTNQDILILLEDPLPLNTPELI